MPRSSEVGAVFAAGLLQGIALVTLPAASAISSHSCDDSLSSAEYGLLFVPRTLTALNRKSD
jgi:hypothetical protein